MGIVKYVDIFILRLIIFFLDIPDKRPEDDENNVQYTKNDYPPNNNFILNRKVSIINWPYWRVVITALSLLI